MSEPKFVHLQCHSEYSIVDGLLRIKPLIQQLQQERVGAIALTDQANLFAMVKFYQAAVTAGIKPIMGSEIWLENPQNEALPYRLILLCQNEIGYRNLTRLVSKAYVEGQIND